ncbi:hypothetical protein A2863_01590 [Candidatus Woesebacteria bacterium RIFCSPHIGHO2_01_FULL_38_9b]|uniref:Uncharacterized protein n=1 Tax=Candidatus Woesebacteria bacterium RIFCSPHIGHO2_01_FULL_38_9b TaxID=1802493 RepID=A0A1F7Y0G6_9BACT|nr:MAG: hypothetical protein A2863_01590 [Candidatus Woesebacteria bacterium RIFCSPHIGHO2_01_FULL_38_9b]
MHESSKRYFPRDIEAGNFIENFLVSAVASILVIRVFLFITGYPALGGQNFHIAHLLFGGFLMMSALVILFIFLNKDMKYVASIIGGIGFGTFIDELGKFLTRDNNYFYQPAIAIIYVIFVLLFLGLRIFESKVKFSKEEYSVNAIEMTKQVLVHDLDKQEKRLALSYFRKADTENPIVRVMLDIFQNSEVNDVKKTNIFHQIRSLAGKFYIKLTHSPRFAIAIISFFVIASLIDFSGAFFEFSKAGSFAEWGQLIFSIISGVFVIIGVYLLRYKNSRQKSYEMFKIAVLTSIFLTQFFRFLEEQFSAITGLFISLIILSVLQYLIYEEKLLE